jgi:hypothetical protein
MVATHRSGGSATRHCDVAEQWHPGKPGYCASPLPRAGTLPEGGTNWGEVAELSIAQTELIATRLRNVESPDGFRVDHLKSGAAGNVCWKSSVGSWLVGLENGGVDVLDSSAHRLS